MITKICNKCNQLRRENEFRFRSDRGFINICQACEKVYFSSYRKKYIKRNPWLISYCSILSRCKYNSNPIYKRRGIKNFLKIKDLKYLWFRDKAYRLKRPSIDRINNDGHYIIQNCRYIELKENCKQGAIITNALKKQKSC